MTDLIACLSTGKGTWGNVKRIIEDGEWNKILLITNDFGKENFKLEDKKCELILVDSRQPMPDLIETMRKGLEGKTKGTEVALNLISGSGKEHMALLSAIMKLGLGFRQMALTSDGIKEI